MKKPYYYEELKILEAKMDARDRVYKLLQRIHNEGRKIPDEYIAAWCAYQRDPRPWRKIPGARRLIVKAAKKAARGER